LFASSEEDLSFTTNNGNNWTACGYGVSIQNTNRIAAMVKWQGNYFVSNKLDVYVSTDNAMTFTEVFAGLPQQYGLGYYYTNNLLSKGDFLYFGTPKNGIFKMDLNQLSLTLANEENKVNAQELNVYPNPTQGQVILDGIQERGEIRIEVLDVSGKVIKTINTVGQPQLQLNLEGKQGVYIVRVLADKKVSSKRIILQ